MKVVRGYVIRAQKAGDPCYQTQTHKVWSEKGHTPQEWEAIKADESIARAELYTNAQSKVRANKRRFIDKIER